MKSLLIPLSLILILVQLPFGPPAPEKPKEKPSPVKGWQMVSYFSVPPTQYSRVGKGIIKAESLGSRSSLFKEVGEKDKNFRILSWGWKVSNVVRSAIEMKKDRFDAAARVMVVFGEKRGFGIFGIEEPVGPRIEYIWANRLPKGRVFDHPREKNSKIFVLESRESKLGQWVYEKRDIRKDFKTAFGEEPGGIIAIGIQTDTDHSNEMVIAYYSDPVLKKR